MQKKLDQIIHEVYGVGAVACDPLTVIWAADKIEDTEFAKKELDRINKLRESGERGRLMFPTVIGYSNRRIK